MNEQNAVREDFRLYLISVMGLSEVSAKSYDAYVSGVEKLLGKTADAIVASDEEMQAAITQLRKHEQKNTSSNYMSGLRAYYRFKKGQSFNARKRDVHSCGNVGSLVEDSATGDMPYEIRKQLNELEFRMFDRQDALWRQVFQLAVAVLLALPPLIVGRGCSLFSRCLFFVAIAIGSVGLGFMIPILKRPFRQISEIYEHGRNILAGEETRLEIRPPMSNKKESLCQILSVMLLLLSLVMLLVSVGVSLLWHK